MSRQPEYSYHALIIIWIRAHFKDNGKSTWLLHCSGEGYASSLARVNMSALLGMYAFENIDVCVTSIYWLIII